MASSAWDPSRKVIRFVDYYIKGGGPYHYGGVVSRELAHWRITVHHWQRHSLNIGCDWTWYPVKES